MAITYIHNPVYLPFCTENVLIKKHSPMNRNRRQNAPSAGWKATTIYPVEHRAVSWFIFQHALSTARLHILFVMILLLPYFAEKKFGLCVSKKAMLKVLTPLWLKEHPTSTIHRRKISVLLTLCNIDHKQVLGFSAWEENSPCKPPKCQSWQEPWI